MDCVDEVKDLVIDAQNAIIGHKGSIDFWDVRITNAITQCSALGKMEDRNDLVLKVRDHLKKVGLEAGKPKVESTSSKSKHINYQSQTVMRGLYFDSETGFAHKVRICARCTASGCQCSIHDGQDGHSADFMWKASETRHISVNDPRKIPPLLVLLVFAA